jgi:peptidoglycan/xylan/chitin deacetylase (PgdA/CDA1 family)
MSLPSIVALPLLLLSIGGLRPITVPPSSSSPEPILIKRVPTADLGVAITFDACATKTHGYGFDRAIFDVLKRESVPATIFVSGRWVESHPGAMAELVADPRIEFGDHSYDHPHMARLTQAQIAEEIDHTEATLARFGKRSVAFRPPFGEWNRRLLHVVQDKQLPAVLWDVVSGDPSAGTTAPGMIRTVLRGARPGSIIIFHINGRGTKTAQALPVIVRELRARGLRLVHLSELLAESSLAIPQPRSPVEPPPYPSPFPPPLFDEPRSAARDGDGDGGGGALPAGAAHQPVVR